MPRPRFALRTLLIVVTVFCCWLGWEVYGVQSRSQLRQSLITQIEKRGGEVHVFDDGSWRSRYLGDRVILSVHFPRGFADTSYDLLVKTKAAYPLVQFSETWQEEFSGGSRDYVGKDGEFDFRIY